MRGGEYEGKSIVRKDKNKRVREENECGIERRNKRIVSMEIDME